jgi:outer membrane protein assembly factor BamB
MKEGADFGTGRATLRVNPADGSTIWKATIGADSDSTPAVVNGFVYTAAEDGVVRCYKQDTGELVWKFVTDGGHSGRASEHIGIWASPIYSDGNIYIGASDGSAAGWSAPARAPG